MTSKDHNSMNDAEFDALLEGRGELAELLQSVPQPQPSAELDEKILAAAEAALNGGTPALPSAANDARIPDAVKPVRRDFLMRWKVPLALAASVFIVVHTIDWQELRGMQEPSEHAAGQTAAAPAAKPAAPPVPAESAAQPLAKSEAPNLEAPAPAAQSHTAAKRQERQARARADTAAPSAEGPLAKAAPLAAPPPAAAPAVPATAATAPAQSAANVAIAPPAPATVVAAPAVPPVAATAPQAAASDQAAVASGAPVREASPVLGMRGQADSAARIKALAPETARSAGAAPQPSAPAAGSLVQGQIISPAPKNPQAWLAQIDKLLKAESKKEALEEWNKFRREYPNYPVAPELAKRIDAAKEALKQGGS